MCCLQETYFKYKDTYIKTYYANTNHRKTRVAIRILDKADVFVRVLQKKQK
jgi:ACT domain-containing protein